MLTPNYWRFKRACRTVHEFSLEVIRKRRADLEELKVGHTHLEHPETEIRLISLRLSEEG